MFDFETLLGKPSAEQQAADDFAAGFAEGVKLSHRLTIELAKERQNKGAAFVNGVLMALKEEI